ncbi:hypothetical protein OSB04_un001099 [Centaurea solstitialis]|uniref:FLZ-type domain-containing protein n=1 Tax=Centaurea solstitialis TaxID=347529 RepID=A0AA38W599_9ASTR|nr:hypothetical protein OSB04_un001099 [Centaurea solstitialis]
MLGKKARPPIRRTTSMTKVTVDLTPTATVANSQPPYDPFNINPSPDVTPRNHRRNSADHMEFLTVCHLCDRRLLTGRDIFMYKGDSAFCSYECRQEKMNEDEKKDKNPMVPKKPAVMTSESSKSN